MNSFEGGNTNNNDNNGWENLLLGFGGGTADYTTGTTTTNNNNGVSDNLGTTGGGGASHTSQQAAASGMYDSTGGYAAYLQATYQLNGSQQQHQPPPQDGRNSAGLSVGGGDTSFGYNNNYGASGSSVGGGYSLNIPANTSTAAHYTPQQYIQNNGHRYVSTENGDYGGGGAGGGLSNNSHSPQPQFNNNLPSQYSTLHDNNNNNHNTHTHHQQQQQQVVVQRREHSDESQSNNNNNSTLDNYYGTISGMLGGGGGSTSILRDPSPSPIGNNNNTNFSPHDHTLLNLQPTPVNNNHNTAGGGGGGNDLDYCDALLRGMDDQSFGWLAGAFGVSNATTTTNNNNPSNQQQQQQQQANNNDNNNGYNNTNEYNNYGGGIGGNGGGYHHHLVGEQMALPTTDHPTTGGLLTTHHQHHHQQQRNNSNDELNAFFKQQFAAQQQQQQQQQQNQAASAINTQFTNNNPINTKKKKAAPRTSSSNTKSRSRSTTTQQKKGRGRSQPKNKAGTSSVVRSSISSSSHLPTGRDHSSLPSHQIDPLLEKISLTVTAVSLTPLSGNEVVRHIRTRTDDVITRFLPCVDFLVNCQQELRQGLQIAQRANQAAARRSSTGGGRSRSGGGMTPRQFHATYVAPLPKRFERTNDGLMAREYLLQAKVTMEQLVRDAHTAIPQGCDHVKNAFLGGMRENQSWGLRKWLSKHGGAGSICNDLEEVTRHVKALKKEDETTQRLAGMLRPIAKQAHDRLKKDVPQAYQEQSSAHPYLPFFHRLEACLKQMATYDPEEDDVICLDLDSSDEEDAVKVVSRSPVKVSSFNHASSTPVKKRSPKVQQQQQKRSPKRKSNEDIAMTKRSRSDNFTDQFIGSGNGEKKEETMKPKAATAKNEPEIICLDDSSDEEDENDTKPLPSTRQEQAQQSNNSDVLDSMSGLAPLETATLSPPRHASISAEPPGGGGSQQWRCNQCTFLNEAFASKCGMCNDDDSDMGGGGNNSGTDDLANFLGGSSFLEGGDSNHSFSASDNSFGLHRRR